MVRAVQKIHPLDLQASVGVGINLPFSAGNVFTTNYTTADAIKYNLINLLLTQKGERYLNPDFGTDIRRQLFSQLTTSTIQELEDTILTEIGSWFPTVSVETLNVTADSNNNSINIYFKYRIIASNTQDEILINITQ